MSKLKTPSTWIRAHKFMVFALLLVVVVGAIGIASVVRAPGKNNGTPANNTQTTKKGKVVCLPHKNSDGPQTMECATGIQTEDAKYYALKDDASAPGESPLEGVSNKQVEVTGTFTQTNDSAYDIVGTITISKLKVLEQR